MNRYILFTAIIVVLSLASCKKFVETSLPSDRIPAELALNSDGSLVAALSGAYASVLNIASTTSLYGASFGDELLITNASNSLQLLQAQENTYDQTTPDFGFFTNYYKAIYNVNVILEALAKPNSVTPAVASQVKGECEFLRAFCYYRLMGYYGTPPLILNSDVTVSSLIGNSSKAQLYDAMLADLQDAKTLLPVTYPSADRVRANKYAVNALLARIYLMKEDWANAELEASAVIAATTVYNMPSDLNTVFLKGSPETIWQVWNQNGYVPYAVSYIPSASSTSTLFYQLRSVAVDAFDAADKRRASWIKAGTGVSNAIYYPYKYKQRALATGTNAEYEVMFRLAEQYLIRAEARAQLNKVADGLDDLNMVHLRSNALKVASADRADLLLKIENERRLELMTEESLRWFDLNRTGRTAFWLLPIKPTFTAKAVLLPYNTNFIIANPNLEQNDGYQN